MDRVRSPSSRSLLEEGRRDRRALRHLTAFALSFLFGCASLATDAHRATEGPRFALEQAPNGADLVHLSNGGEDVAALEPHMARGKVTIFDFYASWCGPCREVDSHVYEMLASRSDIAYRKINIGSWDTPVAKRYLAQISMLPYLVIYGKDGRLVRDIAGLDLDAFDAAVAVAARQQFPD